MNNSDKTMMKEMNAKETKQFGMTLYKVRVNDPEKGSCMVFHASQENVMQFGSQLKAVRPSSRIEIHKVVMRMGKDAVARVLSRLAQEPSGARDTSAFGNGEFVLFVAVPVTTGSLGMLGDLPPHWLTK